MRTQIELSFLLSPLTIYCGRNGQAAYTSLSKQDITLVISLEGLVVY